MEYKNISEYLQASSLTREELGDIVTEAAILLASACSRNFYGEPKQTEAVALPLYYLNEILGSVE